MKIFINKILYIILFSIISNSILAQDGRYIIQLSDGWKFIREDVGLSAPTDTWSKITVPHTWNAIDGQAGGGPIIDENQNPLDAISEAKARKSIVDADNPHLTKGYYQGNCWYAYYLDVPQEWKGKRIFIRFNAATTVARTYINKRLLGEHRGAFTAFTYELTDYLKFDKLNEIRVQVDNSYREDMPPQSGDFNLWGGLYRPVELIVANQICITPLHFSSSGVYLTQKNINTKFAEVEVKAFISNGDKLNRPNEPIKYPAKVTMQTLILNSEGQVVAENIKDTEINPESTTEASLNLTINNPNLWLGKANPYLYDVYTKIIYKGQVIDEVKEKMGFRTIEITKNEGFLLNGKPYPVYGVSRHQDKRDKGWALSIDDEREDMSIIKEIGATAIRNAHYPQSKTWHQLADSLGFLTWDEVPVVNETRPTREYWLNTYEQAREMVYQLYNHPSVAWWSIYNEIENLPMPYSGKELTEQKEIIKGIDNSRIITGASDHGERYYNMIPDQIGFNNYPGWYHGNWPKHEGYVGNLDQFADFIKNRAKEVGKRVAITEYGAGGDIKHHIEGEPKRPNPAHGGPFHPEEWQAYVHEEDWRIMKNNPDLWGTFFWAIFDFAAANRNEGSMPAINTKGIITHDRKIKKDAFFMYKANWNPDPMVYITSRRLLERKINITDIKVYSNCKEVTLKVNGKVVGKMIPDKIQLCHWKNIKLMKGKNKIEVIGKTNNAQTVQDSCDWNVVD